MKQLIAIVIGVLLVGCGEEKLGGVAVSKICEQIGKETLAARDDGVGIEDALEAGYHRAAARLGITVDQAKLAVADGCGHKRRK